MNTVIETILIGSAIAISLGVYFLPTMIAADRKNHAAAIFALNLFLGWTLVGWVGALVMALWTNNTKPVTP